MQPPSSIRNETPGGVEFCLCRDTHDISENVIQEMSHILKNNISLILFYGSDFFTDYDLSSTWVLELSVSPRADFEVIGRRVHKRTYGGFAHFQREPGIAMR